MDVEVKMVIDKDIYDIFKGVLSKSGHSEKNVIENLLINYMSNVMGKKKIDSNIENCNKFNQEINSYYGKAINKIPYWAKKPDQYNHKIIKSYFEVLKNSPQVFLRNMEVLCSNILRPDLYVPTFKTNYASMKYDGSRSHGKVFIDDGRIVTVWKEVEPVLMKYRDNFN